MEAGNGDLLSPTTPIQWKVWQKGCILCPLPHPPALWEKFPSHNLVFFPQRWAWWPSAVVRASQPSLQLFVLRLQHSQNAHMPRMPTSSLFSQLCICLLSKRAFFAVCLCPPVPCPGRRRPDPTCRSVRPCHSRSKWPYKGKTTFLAINTWRPWLRTCICLEKKENMIVRKDAGI